MSRMSKGQIVEFGNMENRGQFGENSGEDYEWLAANSGENWNKFVCGLRTGKLVALAANPVLPVVPVPVVPPVPAGNGLIEVVSPNCRILMVTLDYNKAMEQMAADGRYDYANPNINKKNFSLGRGSGVMTAKVAVFRLDRSASSKAVKEYRCGLGYDRVHMEHILGVGAQFPDLQCELGWIVDVDDVWAGPGDDRRCVPYLSGDSAERGLSLGFYHGDWNGYDWFFGLCK